MDQQGKHQLQNGASQLCQPWIDPDEIAVPLAILSMDDGVVVYANDEFKNIIKGTTVGEPVKGFLNSEQLRQAMNEKLESNHKVVKTLSSSRYTLRFSVSKGNFLDVGHYFLILDKYENTLTSDAQNVVNTEVNDLYLSRAAFTQQLINPQTTDAFSSDAFGSDEACMCVIDIDRFKVVNEKYGYTAGDFVLNELVKLVAENVEKKYVIGRLGGNEFGLILRGADMDSSVQICEVIREKVKGETFKYNNEDINITVSIGVISLNNDDDEERIFARATLALISAQENGRDCVHSSATQDTMVAYHSGKMHYAMVIEDALQNDKFELFAQPIVSLDQPDENYSYEVLLRIYDSQLKDFVSSQELIAAAESLEVTTRIDHWVCENVFKILSQQIEKQVRIPNISINLSGHSIVSVAFEKFLLELTEKYEIPTACICFEITESVAVKSITRAQKFISNMKKVGYRFSLDDFGVGYCSFNYLNQLDVDNVKIDGSFVSAMLDDATQFATVQAITNVARTMNIKTIAEFVEKDEIIKALRVIGVDYGQGYIFGRPSSMMDIF